jgi:hypothetical protein
VKPMTTDTVAAAAGAATWDELVEVVQGCVACDELAASLAEGRPPAWFAVGFPCLHASAARAGPP